MTTISLPKALEVLVLSDVGLQLIGQDAPKRLMTCEKERIYIIGPAHIDAILGVSLGSACQMHTHYPGSCWYRLESCEAPAYRDASGARFGGVFDLSFLYGEGLGEGRIKVQLHQSMRTLPPSFADYISIATEEVLTLATELVHRQEELISTSGR